jgi:predicted esterase
LQPVAPGLFDEAYLLSTRSQPGLIPVKSAFPIVIFSHGWELDHSDYSQIVEEITSHGFYVITVNHPFTSGSVPFLGHFKDAPVKIEDEREIIVKAQDVEFVVQQIKSGCIDLISYKGNNLGVIGHSQGAVVAVESCRRDHAIKVGIDMDGPLHQRPFKTDPIHQPFLTIAGGKGASVYNTHNPEETGEKDWDAFHKQAPRSVKLSIPDADHVDFSIDPFFRHALGGAIPGKTTERESLLQINKTVTKSTVGFLTKHLKNFPRSKL